MRLVNITFMDIQKPGTAPAVFSRDGAMTRNETVKQDALQTGEFDSEIYLNLRGIHTNNFGIFDQPVTSGTDIQRFSALPLVTCILQT